MASNPRKRIVIIGPTASGKTELAIELAQKYQTAIISADSRQCYKYLDIGTAKPDAPQLSKIRHHYISELEPDVRETAADFRRRCDAWEEEYPIEKPLVYAGGSTLYLQALLFNLDEIPASNEQNIQTLLTEEAENGIEKLYQKLEEIDPDYVRQMDGMNRHRIFRALDVWMQTGRPFSSFHTLDFESPRSGFQVIGLQWPREVLVKRINARVDTMIEAGLIDEIRDLLTRYDENLQSLQTVGYREVISHLKGEIPFDRMVEDIKTNTRRYAKRQMTWFRRWPFVIWKEMG